MKSYSKSFYVLNTSARLITIIVSFLAFSFAQAKPTDNIVSIEKIDDLTIQELSPVGRSESLQINLAANGKIYNLSLTPNTRLTKNLKLADTQNTTLYRGEILGVPKSWVRLSKIDGIYSGAIYDGKELYFVDPASAVRQSMSDPQFQHYAALSDNAQVFYKASDVKNTGLCGTENHNQSNSNFNYQRYVDELSVMANSLADRELEVALVADTEFNADYGGNAADRMLIEMNIVDGIFSEQVNVQLSIVYSSVLSNNGNLTMTDAVDLIYEFRDYVFAEVGNPGVTHLFTGKEIDSNTIGIAFVSALCTSSGVAVTQNIGSSTALVAAHEFGHNFGAPHDNQSNSACSSTAGNRLMNPSINGSDQFSVCSLEQIDIHINQANGYTNNQCVVDIVPNEQIAPTINSIPEANAIVGIAYGYDDDSSLDVSGTSPIAFTLDIFPDGMTIDTNGVINWTPSVAQVGTNPVQITASNSAGEDTQIFDITVELQVLNFDEIALSSYGGNNGDTNKGTVTVADAGDTLNLTGNRWRHMDFPYTITENTILEFDFKSTQRGEIHGIGFDDDIAISADKTFKLHGSQSFGINTFSYSGNGSYQHFVIPVGQYYTGAMLNLFFVMDHDVGSPTATSFFSNVSVYEVAGSPPTINSVANINATIGVPYGYDQDNRLNVSGTAPINFTLDLYPDGMTVDSSGLISWTPETYQEGIESVQITASNEFGSTTQSFDISVSPPLDSSVINFNTSQLASYGGSNGDTNKGTVTVEDAGATLNLTGNRWQHIDFPYTITENTILEFDFKSTKKGEIHGIGFDDDIAISADKTFKLHGTQSIGINTFSYSGNGEYQHFSIPVGLHYTGAMLNLFFVMDHDVSSPSANSLFSNVSVYEAEGSPPTIVSAANTNATVGVPYNYDEDGMLNVSGATPITYTLDLFPDGMTVNGNGLISWTPEAFQEGIEAVQITASNEFGSTTQSFNITVSPPLDPAILNFNSSPLASYGGKDGDTNNGTVTIEDSGATLKLVGNRWQRVDLLYTVTPDTILEFDFKSTAIGDIHGIGFDDDIEHSKEKTFKLYGTQNYGNTTFSYTGGGEYQHFVITVGQYYTGPMQNLFFVMDHDASNPSGSSYFSNIKIRN